MEKIPLHFNKYTKRTATNATKCNSINQPLANRIAIYRGNNLSYHGDKNSVFTVKMETMTMGCASFTHTWSTTNTGHNLQISSLPLNFHKTHKGK
jgi:hypothetical protein